MSAAEDGQTSSDENNKNDESFGSISTAAMCPLDRDKDVLIRVGCDVDLESNGTPVRSIQQPRTLQRVLFPHQLRAIYEMEKRESDTHIETKHYTIYSNIGIYADIVGYGKTLSMVGLVLRDKMSVPEPSSCYSHETVTQVFGNGNVVKKATTNYPLFNTTLILANQSILKQWLDEFEHTPLRVMLVNNRRRCDTIDPDLYDVVICSPSMFNHLLSRFPNHAWKRFVFDEPTFIKITSMRRVVAAFHWLITATPDALLYVTKNQHNYLGSLFGGYVDYNVFRNLIVKNDDDWIRESIQLPPITHRRYMCDDILSIVLGNLVSPNIGEMISAGNIDGAVRLLGGVDPEQDTIAMAVDPINTVPDSLSSSPVSTVTVRDMESWVGDDSDMESAQGQDVSSDLFHLIMMEKRDLLSEAEIKIQRYDRIHDLVRYNKWLERKRILEKEIIELRTRIRNISMQHPCHICLNPPVTASAVLLKCCCNIFCVPCISQWVKTSISLNSCPVCRTKLSRSFFIRIEPDTSGTDSPFIKIGTEQLPSDDNVVPYVAATRDTEEYGRRPTKMEVIKQILCHSDSDMAGHQQRRKFVIFSSHEQTFQRLSSIVEDVYRLQGKYETRNKVLETFRSDDSDGAVLFLNSVENGAGLNLQDATDIILFHSMPEIMETQVIGRCYRIGRTTPLVVHHLIDSLCHDDHTT